MTKTVLIIAALALGPTCHASSLSEKIYARILEIASETEASTSDRVSRFTYEVLHLLGSEQMVRADLLPIDDDDARAWLRAINQFGPMLVGARVHRQVGGAAPELIAELENHERRTWALLDDRLEDGEREALRRLYPVLARAALRVRPTLQTPMIQAHAAANNYDLTKTAAVYGMSRIAWTAFVFTMKVKLGRLYEEQISKDILYGQTFVALARYLRVPSQAGFCQDNFEKI